MKVSLKAARVNANLRQRQAAEALGVSIDRIKYLETSEGSANINYETLLKMCALYGCTPDDIFLPIDYPKSEAVEGAMIV